MGRGSHRKGNSSEPPHALERWEGGPISDSFKASPVASNAQEASCQEGPEPGKRRPAFEPEGESGLRKRKAEATAADRTPKSQAKSKSRITRSGDWLPAGSPKKQEERTLASGQEQGLQEASSSSSEDEASPATEPTTKEEPRGHPKTKGSPAKKYNGLKEKSKGGRASSSAFWEIPEKRAKVATGCAEERQGGGCRTKGQKDVWSSIQAQWPKKTLKELFSDSDTEAQNSPPPPPPAVAPSEEPSADMDAECNEHTEEDEPAEEEPMEEDKMPEYPTSSGSGSNSVLNTPPTTPESPTLSNGGSSASVGGAGGGGGGGGAPEASSRTPACSSPVPPPQAPATPASATVSASGSPAVASPAGPLLEEGRLGRSESDSSTVEVEVESLGGELQEMTPQEERAGSPSKAFETSLSCNSNSTCSLDLSNGSQQESEQKSKGKEGTKLRS